MQPILSNCPVCHHALTVQKLHCSHCQTTIENNFHLNKFSLLSADQLHFIETFIISRGNIKEVEKELGISYPTVRSKLNAIITALGHESAEQKKETDESAIIAQLERGEITADEAIKHFKK